MAPDWRTQATRSASALEALAELLARHTRNGGTNPVLFGQLAPSDLRLVAHAAELVKSHRDLVKSHRDLVDSLPGNAHPDAWEGGPDGD